MFRERTSVGLDVHARSVVAVAIDGQTGEVFRARLTPSHGEVFGWLGKLPGPCAVVYESGPTGFGLARTLSAAGWRCEVAASSKLCRPAGDRVKTDARDALYLARLLRLGEIVPVRIPTRAEEAARDLVRAREAAWPTWRSFVRPRGSRSQCRQPVLTMRAATCRTRNRTSPPFRGRRRRWRSPAALDSRLHIYNHPRPHTALGGRPPISRVTNVSGQNT